MQKEAKKAEASFNTVNGKYCCNSVGSDARSSANGAFQYRKR